MSYSKNQAEAPIVVGVKAVNKARQEENLRRVQSRPFYWTLQKLLAVEGRTHSALAHWIDA